MHELTDGGSMLRQAGVFAAMDAADRRAYSLQWTDGAGRFWLNPCDQLRFAAGWYTIDELLAWTRGEGPACRIGELSAQQREQLSAGRFPSKLPRWAVLRVKEMRERAAAAGQDVRLAATCRRFIGELAP